MAEVMSSKLKGDDTQYNLDWDVIFARYGM
jgi:hypothetical protein